MSFVQADLDNLDSMIKRGVLKTVYNGSTVEYRTMSELMQARALIAGELAGAAGVSRSTLAAFSNGLRS